MIDSEIERLAAEPVPEADAETAESWSIQDLAGADWALSRMADLERELAENNQVVEAAISRLRARAQHLNERVERGIVFFRSRLAAYAEAHRAELLGGGKKKSRALLHGVIGWRKRGGGLEVKDKDALLEWARRQPIEAGFLRITESPAIDEIKRACRVNGELPDGCELAAETEELRIEAVMGGTNE